MARSAAVKIVRVPSKPIIVRQPGMLRRGKTRALAALRRGGSRAAQVAREEKHTLTALAGAAGMGLLRKYSPETMETLTFGPLGPEAVVGLAAWGVGKFAKSQVASHLATGLMSVAVYRYITEEIEGF